MSVYLRGELDGVARRSHAQLLGSSFLSRLARKAGNVAKDTTHVVLNTAAKSGIPGVSSAVSAGRSLADVVNPPSSQAVPTTPPGQPVSPSGAKAFLKSPLGLGVVGGLGLLAVVLFAKKR